MSKIKPAFTLAEVLITLGVIGIVAAMTLPTLVANYKNKVLLHRAKNSYSILSNAMQMVKSRNNLDSYADLFNNSYTEDEIIDILSKDLKMVKICKKNKGGCWTWKTKPQKKTYHNGKILYLDFKYNPSAILADGSVIEVTRYPHSGDCRWTNGIYSEGRCGNINIDVNGEKGPNQFGLDTWSVDVYPQKLTVQYYSLLYDDNLYYENYNEDEAAN